MDMNLHDLFFDVTLPKEMSAFLNYISICQVYICMNDNLKAANKNVPVSRNPLWLPKQMNCVSNPKVLSTLMDGHQVVNFLPICKGVFLAKNLPRLQSLRRKRSSYPWTLRWLRVTLLLHKPQGRLKREMFSSCCCFCTYSKCKALHGQAWLGRPHYTGEPSWCYKKVVFSASSPSRASQ